MNDDNNKETLLKKLSILDFIAVDLALFLDTHPNDKEAIEKYNSIIEEADSLRYDFEEMYGPLCSFRSMSPECNFKWIDCPWPWQCDFNFNVRECF